MSTTATAPATATTGVKRTETARVLAQRRRRSLIAGSLTTLGGLVMASGAAMNWFDVRAHVAGQPSFHKLLSGAADPFGLGLLFLGIVLFFRGIFIWGSPSRRSMPGIIVFLVLDALAIWNGIIAVTSHITTKLFHQALNILVNDYGHHHVRGLRFSDLHVTTTKPIGAYLPLPAALLILAASILLILWRRVAPRVKVLTQGEGGRPVPLVKLTGVKKYFPITRGVLIQKRIGNVHAVDGVDLEIYPGETVGLVGETGCGKSTLARVVMRLYAPTDGNIYFDGEDVTTLDGQDLRELRRNMQMMFQDPFASLNPRKVVGSIIGEPYRLHRTVPRNKIKDEVKQLMELVGLNPEHYNRFPHEFSGGQRQRIGVARALALRPRLIVCDEPVSALDVSIQAQVLNLLEDLQEEFKLTYLFIAHDLSVVRHVSDRVAVMYLGRVVEMASGDELYRNPKHPYTGALLSAVPIPDPDLAAHKRRIILEGDVPSPIDPPSGCRFHPRCPRAQFPTCREVDPVLETFHEGQVAACHFPLEDRAMLEATGS